MTRRVHTIPPGERTETPKALASYHAFRDLGPSRSISKLHELFLKQADESRGSGGKTPMPPTTSKKMLEEWCTCFGWVARVTVWEAECDYARRTEMRRQIEAQAAQNAKLMQDVGQGALAVVAVALNHYVDPQTGVLREHIQPRDVPGLMKAGSELLQLSTGQPTTIVQTGDTTALEKVLREAPDEVRSKVLLGMRAALEWQQRNQTGD